MKRGTSALIAASSRTVCVSTITSRNPCSADTTQDAPEHAGVTSEVLLKSTLAIATPSSCSRSILSRAVPWRTSALTPVSYTHLRAHETRHDLVCRLLL